MKDEEENDGGRGREGGEGGNETVKLVSGCHHPS